MHHLNPSKIKLKFSGNVQNCITHLWYEFGKNLKKLTHPTPNHPHKVWNSRRRHFPKKELKLRRPGGLEKSAELEGSVGSHPLGSSHFWQTSRTRVLFQMARKQAEGTNTGGKGTKGHYFKASDAQKIALLKKMLELKHVLYGRFSLGQQVTRSRAWEQVHEFATGELGMRFPTLRHLRASLNLWKSSAIKKYDHNRWDTNSFLNSYQKTPFTIII